MLFSIGISSEVLQHLHTKSMFDFMSHRRCNWILWLHTIFLRNQWEWITEWIASRKRNLLFFPIQILQTFPFAMFRAWCVYPIYGTGKLSMHQNLMRHAIVCRSARILNIERRPYKSRQCYTKMAFSCEYLDWKYLPLFFQTYFEFLSSVELVINCPKNRLKRGVVYSADNLLGKF